MAIQDGDMGRALGFFQQCLQVDPSNVQTQKMVARLTAVGTVPIFDDDDGATVLDVTDVVSPEAGPTDN